MTRPNRTPLTEYDCWAEYAEARPVEVDASNRIAIWAAEAVVILVFAVALICGLHWFYRTFLKHIPMNTTELILPSDERAEKAVAGMGLEPQVLIA
jgi:cbb3-type cytochrome oxidase subunit 3